MKKSTKREKTGISKSQSKRVSKPSRKKSNKKPEIEGLEEAEQPLFYHGPAPAIRILYANKHEFDDDFHPFDLIKHMQEGSSRSEICAAWGITYSKFNEWLDKYPAMAEAYSIGKPAYDAYYKRALRHSAFGQAKGIRENSLFFMLKNTAGFSEDGGNHEYGDAQGAEIEFVDE